VDRISGQNSTELFRIFQELLAHVARHPGATVIWVTLKEEAAWLILDVSDNGPGLTGDDADPQAGGFASLKERAVLLGGDLSIDHSAGQGVAMTVKIPI
jgi:signal transduction histidine kinase